VHLFSRSWAALRRAIAEIPDEDFGRPLAALDIERDVTTGPPGLQALLDTPNGHITI
jgi:hypothetical protein